MSLERFLPDTPADGLLRPLLMIEPASMHYFEGLAPDLRWALILTFLVAGWLARNRLRRINGLQKTFLATLFACFYVWTFVAGNGRYFLAGLMFVGPCVFVAARSVPGSEGFRRVLLLGGVALHFGALATVYDNDGWRWAKWFDGPAVGLNPSPLLNQPATYFSLSSNTHAAFVPHVHPQSSWVSFRDAVDAPDEKTKARLLELLSDSKKPPYVLIARDDAVADDRGQPSAETSKLTSTWLSRHELSLTGSDCVSLPFPSHGEHPMRFGAATGFWACPIKLAEPSSGPTPTWRPPEEVRRAYALVEKACARHFPSSGWKDVPVAAGWLRSYPGSEMRLFVDRDTLYYAYYLTLVGTPVGSLAELRDHPPQIDCQRLAGRYRPPWLRN